MARSSGRAESASSDATRVGRALAALSLALFALGQALVLAHRAREAHVACAEHGQIEHAPLENRECRDGASPAEQGGDGPSVEPRASEEHAACAFEIARKDDPWSGDVTPARVALAPGECAPLPSRGRGAHAAPFALHLLAPKTSPPRA